MPPTTNGNGHHGLTRYGGLPDPFVHNALRELAHNQAYLRSQFYDRYVDGRRDIDAECNYPRGEFLPIGEFRYLYAREPIAERVVNLWPKECWQVQPEIYEDEDPDNETDFEKAFDDLGQVLVGPESSYSPKGGSPGGHPLWAYLKRADILSGIGTFGVILLGIDDGKLLEEPVAGVPPDGNPYLWKDRAPEPVPAHAVPVDKGLAGYATTPGPFQSKQFARPPEIVNPSQAGPQTPGSYGTVDDEGRATAAEAGTGTADMETGGRAERHDFSQPAGQDRGPGQPSEATRLGRFAEPQWGPQDELSKDIYGGMTQEQKLSSTMGTDAQYFGTQFTPTSRHDGNPLSPMKGGGYYPSDNPQHPGGTGSATSPPNRAYGEDTTRQGPGGAGPTYPPSDEWAPGHAGSATAPPGRRLIFLRCYDESLVQVVQYEADVRNPRFGLPLMYLITLNDPQQPHTGVGLPLASVRVHWSRVIHIADNLRNSQIFGIPRMQPVLNRLLDLRKIYAGGAEGYWKCSLPIISLETNPQLGGDVIIDQTKVDSTMYKIMNSLQRYMVLTGMSAKTVAPSIVDPSSQVDKQIEAICIEIGCPIRVFKGSERGELASSQDDSQWNDRLRHRQQDYLSPMLIAPFIDRLILIGVLPRPKQYYIQWPDLDSQTDSQKAQILLQKTQALAAYVGGNVESILPPIDYYTEMAGMEDTQAQRIIDRADEQQQQEQQDAAALAQQHGFQPTPPSGYQNPPPPEDLASQEDPARGKYGGASAAIRGGPANRPGKPNSGNQGDAADASDQPAQAQNRRHPHPFPVENVGGPGSGFYGHAGRPGEVGGSVAEGAAPDLSKVGGPTGGRRGLLAKEMQLRARQVPFDPEHKYVEPDEPEPEVDRDDLSAIEQELTSGEEDEMQEYLDRARSDYINEYIDQSEIPEPSLEDVLDEISEGRDLDDIPEHEIDEAMQKARDAAEEDVRERIEQEYDDSGDREYWLQQFYDDHPDRFLPKELPPPDPGQTDKWLPGDDPKEGWYYQFRTHDNNDYLVRAIPQKLADVPAIDFEFRDLAGSKYETTYGVTGKGGAHEVFGKVVPAILSYVDHEKPDFMYFTAKEKSRQKLYDRLVKSVAATAPGYSAVAITGPDTRYYGVMKRELKDAITAKLKEKAKYDVTPEILVNLRSELNPLWFSPQGWGLVLHGGEGSGHFGHAGRPGEVGGSAPTSPSGRPIGVISHLPSALEKEMAKRAGKVEFTTARIRPSEQGGAYYKQMGGPDEPEDKWFQDDSDAAWWYAFKTTAGERYLINIYDVYQDDMSEASQVLEFRQRDADPLGGQYAITGAGHAHEVFGKVVPAVLAFIEHEKPELLTFSAEEPSRKKLYDRLAKSVGHFDRNYSVAAAQHTSWRTAGKRQYFIMPKSRKQVVLDSIGQGNYDRPQVLANVSQAFNPLWFTPEGWQGPAASVLG